MENKNTKKLKVHFDPSQIFEIVELSTYFQNRFSSEPILSSTRSNPSYNIQKSLKKRNIVRRRPFLYKIQNASLYGHSNLISTDKNETAFLGLVFNLNPHKIFGGQVNEFKSDEQGITVNYNEVLNFEKGLFIGGSENFGHWLFNCLGRLNYLTELERNIPIIVHDYMPERFFECIRYFSLNPIIKVPKDTLCIFKEIFVGTTTWYVDEKQTYWWNENTVNFLHDNFTKNKKCKAERLIFLSRQNTNWRQISNEKNVCERLLSLNFEIIKIEDLSIEKQINLALEAKTIIAPLGASSCTFIFGKNSTKCVTIAPNICSPMFVSELYCGPLNLPHKWVIGKNIIGNKTSINSDYSIPDDFNWEEFI